MSTLLRASLAPEIEKTAAILLKGGIAVYPTETFYAIGCLAGNGNGARLIRQVKARPAGKPMPLIAADLGQVAAIADISQAPPELIKRFWPGPLTLILPALGNPAPETLDNMGRVAIRVSASPLARALAHLCAMPLVATSANISGGKPTTRASGLDPVFTGRLGELEIPWILLDVEIEAPARAKPSTIIEPARLGDKGWVLRLIRPGAIDINFAGIENCRD